MPTLDARPGWANAVPELLPGQHLAVFSREAGTGIEGRSLGLELRDTLMVLRPGPVASFIFLFRRALSEKTLAEQVLKTRTGGLNIDACRAATTDALSNHARSAEASLSKGQDGNSRAQETHVAEGQLIGRWASNVVLVHAPGCRTGQIVSDGHSPRHRAANEVYGGGKGTSVEQLGGERYVVLETATAWECSPGCPVPILDEQSGERRSAGDYPSTSTNDGDRNTFGTGLGRQGQLYADSGGASRFYPQLKDEAELRAWVTRLISCPPSP